MNIDEIMWMIAAMGVIIGALMMGLSILYLKDKNPLLNQRAPKIWREAKFYISLGIATAIAQIITKYLL